MSDKIQLPCLSLIILLPQEQASVEFRVSTLKDLVDVILPHFDNYPHPLDKKNKKKHSDYLLFKQIVLLMLNKEHNTLEGLQKIVNLRASLNTGLSNDLKEAFPITIPATLNLENSATVAPDPSDQEPNKNNNLDPEWVAGFSTGESNFFIADAYFVSKKKI